MNYSIDWDGPGEWDDDECDCMDEEIDILEGTAKCWRCGSRRYLSGEEFKRRMEAEARWHAEYDEEMRRADMEDQL